MESKLSEMMQSAMNSVKRLVEVNNIIGEPINTADGLTLVPISKVSDYDVLSFLLLNTLDNCVNELVLCFHSDVC